MPYRNIVYSGRYHSGVIAGAAGADAATAGKFWIVNNVGSDVLLQVRRILFTAAIPVAASTALTRVTAEKMTFTGTPTGAQGVPAANDDSMTLSSNVSVRTASTGMTITAGAVIGAGLMGTDLTVAGAATAVPVPIYDADLHNGMVFRPGGGLVVRQADAGDTDQAFILNVDFDVFTF